MNRVLDIAILGLLMERDHHGYEIRAQLRDRLGLSANASFGSIYPALNRFEREGLVEAVATSDVSALSTGSLSGERASLRTRRGATPRGRRGRKVYSITARGRDEFARLLADPSTIDDARSFPLRMALARYLTPSSRVGLLEQRRANLMRRLAEVRQHAASDQLDGYARSVMEHGVRTVELEIDWVDSLLQHERTTPEAVASEPR